MKAYILPSGVSIEPFGDPVSEAMIGNRSLAEHQDEVLRHAGLDARRVGDPAELPAGEYLLTWDDVFFTRRVVDDLVARFRSGGEPLRCGLPADSLLVRRTRPVQAGLEEAEAGGERLVLYRLALVRAAHPPRDEAGVRRLLEEARPVRARFREKVIEVPTPRNIMGRPTYSHPVTSSVVLHLGHWVHLLWANQLSIQIRWVETILDHKLWAASRLLQGSAGALRQGRLRPSAHLWGWFGRLNRIGRGCDIHPTARLEGVILGDRVRVGAYTLMRGCLVGEDTVIEDRANVLFSVIGPRSFMSKNASMTFCAGYPDSDLSIRGVQCSLFGRHCAMTSAARVIDYKVQGEIQVLARGRLVSAGTHFLGACFGHGVFAGLDVTVQAGRAVPNGAVLVMNPDGILRDIPADLPPGVPAWTERGRATTGKK